MDELSDLPDENIGAAFPITKVRFAAPYPRPDQMDIIVDPGFRLAARLAFLAGVSVNRARSSFKWGPGVGGVILRAVHGFGKGACGSRLPNARRPREEVGVRNPIAADRSLEPRHGNILSDDCG